MHAIGACDIDKKYIQRERGRAVYRIQFREEYMAAFDSDIMMIYLIWWNGIGCRYIICWRAMQLLRFPEAYLNAFAADPELSI